MAPSRPCAERASQRTISLQPVVVEACSADRGLLNADQRRIDAEIG